MSWATESTGDSSHMLHQHLELATHSMVKLHLWVGLITCAYHDQLQHTRQFLITTTAPVRIMINCSILVNFDYYYGTVSYSEVRQATLRHG